MADFSTLIATLQATIKTNYNQEITGQILQDDLLAMVNTINQLKQDTLEGYGFYGAPLADGASVSVTQNTFFLVGAGTYTINGEANTIAGAGISLLVYDSVNDEVRVYSLFPYDTTPTEDSPNAITSGAAAAAIAPLATKAEVALVAGEAGLAEAVIDTDGAGTEQEFTFRKSGGDGGAYYRKIKGKSVVVNQLATPIGAQTLTENNCTITHDGNGETTIIVGAGGASANTLVGICSLGSGSVTWKTGHKYLCKSILNFTPGDDSIRVGNNYYLWWNEATYIWTADGSNGGYSAQVVAGCPAGTYIIKQANVIDLTLWFGAGNEPTTVAEFEALYPEAYYPDNPGTLISNDAEAVETTGVNQWDEEWENAYLNADGTTTPYSGIVASKNFIPVIAGAQYYFKFAQAGGRICYYDSNKNFVSTLIYNTRDITIPSGVAYMKFDNPSAYGTTYNHDICINLSNPAINGQYFPYWKRTLQLGITTRKDTDGNVPFADGMKGAGTAADWADKVGGEKRMKRVDLGNVNWEYNATYQFFIGTTILDNPIGVAGVTPNMICPKYETYETRYDSQVAGGPDKIISGYSAANGVIIHDTDHSAADLVNGHAAWLEGVMLDYELATPVPFTWAEPLNLGVKVDENGTERAVAPEGATEPSAPFVADTTYTMSVARMVEKLQNL